MATRQTAHDDTDVAVPRVSQRALTIGLCATIVAIAFETISVATAMPVAARELDGLRYYAWAFSLFLIGMLFATVVCGRLSDRIATASLQLAGQRLGWAGLGLLIAGLAMLFAALPQLMPPGFLRFRRGLSQVIQTRGLLPGAFFGAEAFVPLMLVEQRSVPLVQAGAVLTFGAVGWTAGSWLQSRPWLLIRRDVLITLGCGLVALGLALVAVVAFFPALPYGLVALSWVLGGLGMGLATSSTSLAVMSLSAAGEQGRNGSSLNVYDALGSAIFIGVAGTIFAALHPSGNLALTLGVVEGAMAVVALLAVLTSLRIVAVRNEFSPAG